MAGKAFVILMDELNRLQGNVAQAEAWLGKCEQTLENAKRSLQTAERELQDVEQAMRLIDPESAEIFVEAAKEGS